MEAMWRLYRGMRTSDLEPTAVTFTNMANAHALAKDLAGLRRVCELAEVAEVKLNSPFFTTILRGFSKLGGKEDFNKALADLKSSGTC